MDNDDLDMVNGRGRLAFSWNRPPGVPKIWQVFSAVQKLEDQTTRDVRLAIHDIPEERYDDAVDFMCEYFIKEEVTCKSLKLEEDMNAVNDLRSVWYRLLKQGMSIGAFVMDSHNIPTEIAGINILYVVTDEMENTLEDMMMQFKSSKLRDKFLFMSSVYEQADVCALYGVDKYIDALGLAIKPAFRGQGLEVRLLQTRDLIGRRYGILATSGLFMGPSSQIQAERAGYVTVYTEEYDGIIGTDGHPLFPNIESQVVKAMVRKLG